MGLLERTTECTRLDAVIARVASGEGDVVVVEGPPGIGKSALLDRMVGRCAAEGVACARARATELGATVSFGLTRRLLEAHVRGRPELLEAGWARRARPVFDGDVPGGGLAGPLVEGLLALVAELVRSGGPAVLAVDDAQWADSGSMLFLGELAERAAELGAGLVVAVTSGAPATDASTLARIAARAGDSGLLALPPLSAAAIRTLVAERMPGAHPDLPERLAAATGGHPLLVVTLLDAAEPGDVDLPEVPPGVVRLVLSRLASLAPDAQALARAVAVLGEAPLRVVGELAGLPAARADAAADELVARHILAQGEPVHFSQGVVAEALRATMPPFELAARHGEAAAQLSRDGADDERIAAHLLRTRAAGDRATCRVLSQAAAAALGRGDPAGAVRLLQRAVAEPPPAEERGTLLVRLAQAQAAAGLPTAIDAFRRALADVRDRSARAQAWHGLSRLLYMRGDHRLAVAAAQSGLAELDDGDPMCERLLADELAAALFVPELTAGAAARTESLARGADPADPALLAHVIVHQTWTGIELERLPDRAAAAVASDPLVDPESGGFALSFVAGALNMADQTVLSLRLLDAGLDCVAARGDPLAEVSLRCCRAWALFYQGRLAAARRDLDEVAALNRLGWTAIDGLSGPPLVCLRIELGDLAGAREAFHRTPRGLHNPGLDWFEGTIASAAGDHAAALAAYQRAGQELEGQLGLGNPGVLPWRSSAAMAAAALGRRAEAEALIAVELEQAQALPVPRAHGIALRVAGVVRDDPELLQRSVDVLEHSPAQLELARSLLHLGIAHRHARRTRDARAPLGRALDSARELGAVALAERALGELRAAGARPRSRPRVGLQALTPSERNVAQRAAAGRTTRQIAAELFLTPKTVESHLTRVFRKLRITSRGELAPLLAPPAESEPEPDAPAART